MKDTHFVNLVILNRENFLQTLKYTVLNIASISSVKGQDRQITSMLYITRAAEFEY